MSFTVPTAGRPAAKERPRFNAKTGGVYTPHKTTEAEEAIRMLTAGQSKLFGPVKLTLKVMIPRPKGHTKVQRNIPYVSTRPDADNYLKTVMDGLDLMLHDDAQIAVIVMSKLYADDGPPRWEIQLEELL